MKRVIVLIVMVIFLFVSSLFAKPVLKDKSAKVVKTFLKIEQFREEKRAEKLAKEGKKILKSIQKHMLGNTTPIYGEENQILAWITDLDPEGFIVTSAEDRIKPVIAYSFAGKFPFTDSKDNILLHLVQWDMQTRLNAVNTKSKDYLLASDAYTQEWAKYETGNNIIIPLTDSLQWPSGDNDGWLDTTWYQRDFYQDCCPFDPVNNPTTQSGLLTGTVRCVTGCTATAMAQIVNYWQYPTSISLTNTDNYLSSYTPKGGSERRIWIDVVPDGGNDGEETYEYEYNPSMANINYNQNGVHPSNQTISKLIYACGVLIKQNYSDNWTEGYNSQVRNVLENRFGYATADLIDATDSNFYQILQQNMKDGCPAQLGISGNGGHAIVCDGYREPDKYHLNFGWGSSSPDSITDTWYALPSELPAGYSVVDGGVLNIYPQTIDCPVEADTYISSYTSLQNTNFGTQAGFSVDYYTSTQDDIGLIKFDLSNIPSDSVIKSAELQLTVSVYPTLTPPANVKLYRLTQGWDEGSVTWLNGNPVIGHSPLEMTDYINQGDIPVWSWHSDDYPELKTAVQAWYNDESDNKGMCLWCQWGTHGIWFYSKEAFDSINRPKLIVYYTPPAKRPYIVSPENGSINQPVSGLILQWANGGGAVSYNVYFGTDQSPDDSEYKGNQMGSTYNPGTLQPDTTYYWRIDTVNSEGIVTTGTIWRLTTVVIYGGGSGTAENPYQIWTPEQMNCIGASPGDMGKHFNLMADIDMSIYTDTEYKIIRGFTGTFDGGGHIISNITITASSQDYVGLFGTIANPGQIKNLGVKNMNIIGQEFVGGLVGIIWNGTVTDCYVTGSITGVKDVGGLVGRNGGSISRCHVIGSVYGIDRVFGGLVGGLVGENYWGTITDCYFTGSVNGGFWILGGLVGENYKGTIAQCYSAGWVDGNCDNVGGLVGSNNIGSISESYSHCSVIGEGDSVGGLLGENYIGNGFIRNCYATGTVNGSYDIGGLVGNNWCDDNTIINCFWDIEASLINTSDGGTGKTTGEMQTLSTFTSAGWDFINETANGTNDYWLMRCEGMNYPKLSWQNLSYGDFSCPDGIDPEDLSYYVSHWLMNNCTSTNNYCGGADLNYSGVVDLADWAIFAENWLSQ